MQNFCHDCSHRKIPSSIKGKFNESVKPIFTECPYEDIKVVGCFIKWTTTIDWKAFIKWLDDHGRLEESEKKNCKLIKMYQENHDEKG